VDDRGDENLGLFNDVDNSIAVGNQFADLFVVEFWNFPPCVGKLSEGSYQCDDSAYYSIGVRGRISRDKQTDLIDIGDCPR